MSYVAVAVGGSALVGAGASIYGSSKASDAQSQAAAQALAFQKQVYADQQRNFKPYLDTGSGATYSLGKLMGIGGNGQSDYSGFYNSPDYKFAQQQGELGIERGANARGMNLSGGTLRDLSQFNSGLATQQYGKYYDRLMGLSQLGQASAAGSAANGTQMGGQIGNTMMGQGQAQASGYVGTANAINGGLSSGTSNALMANYLNRSPSAYAGSGPAYGGNNGEWGGSSANPLPGLSASDYGAGY